ncbi:MAG: hypothetical protein EOP61_20795 [Sphingomonadales bacterium]|nr:MAG: hypothetical protein EOP61_20795 [Sphingomonadales bacterium]
MIKRHRITGLLLGGLLLSMPAQAPAQRALGPVLAEIDQGFVCPQFRPDDEARRADMLAFSRAIASVGPKKISYRQAAYIHARMLERHNCTGSATAVASVEPAETDTGAGAGN